MHACIVLTKLFSGLELESRTVLCDRRRHHRSRTGCRIICTCSAAGLPVRALFSWDDGYDSFVRLLRDGRLYYPHVDRIMEFGSQSLYTSQDMTLA